MLPDMEDAPMSATVVETAKQVRTALRRAFPRWKFSVTSSGSIYVRWTDDGPTIEEVQDVLLAAGCAEARMSWDQKRWLYAPGGHADAFWFDRYNAVARAAETEERERRIEQSRLEAERVKQVIADAWRAKRAQIEPLPAYQAPPAIQDPAIHAAFERLRQRAENEVAAHTAENSERRSSWAPPLTLGEELALVCRELGHIDDDDKWIGRLWATFATPKRSGRWLRQHVSKLPLEGYQCRGFELYAGATRQSRGALLFEAQRTESGNWRFGPHETTFPFYSTREREWEDLLRARERARSTYCDASQAQELERQLARVNQQIAAIEAEDQVKATAYGERKQLRQRALELARARVLDFIGAPDAQMQLAARLAGHCCVCWKELTDPVSLERGIGPDCLEHKIKTIHYLVERGDSLEIIAVIVGMPMAFVTEVVNEERV
jgi:hypothetical protein